MYLFRYTRDIKIKIPEKKHDNARKIVVKVAQVKTPSNKEILAGKRHKNTVRAGEGHKLFSESKILPPMNEIHYAPR